MAIRPKFPDARLLLVEWLAALDLPLDLLAEARAAEAVYDEAATGLLASGPGSQNSTTLSSRRCVFATLRVYVSVDDSLQLLLNNIQYSYGVLLFCTLSPVEA